MVDAEEKVAATRSSLLSGNLLIAVWVALGTVGLYLIDPLYGWLYL